MSTKRIWIALCACIVAFSGGYGMRVLAEGAPATQPLFYSGVLESGGQLASGEHTIALELFDAQSGGEELCSIERTADVAEGRFRIDASECADAMRQNADTWVAVAFRGEDGVERSISGRSKIGAVPYALEADRAKAASAATGALETTIAQLTARIEALEGNGGGPPLAQTAFQGIFTGAAYEEVFDLGDEFDPQTGVFKPAADGRYEFVCSIAWSIDDHDHVGIYEATIHLDGVEVAYNGFTTDGIYGTRQVHAVLELTAGQEVECRPLSDQNDVDLNVSGRNNSFVGRRFSL